MGTFEIGAGTISATANNFFATVHRKFHKEFFTGAATEEIEIPLVGKIEAGITWDAMEAPTVVFLPPEAPKEFVEKEIAKQKLPETIEKNRAELVKSLTDAVVVSSFGLKLPKIVTEIKDPTGTLPPKDEFAVNSIVILKMSDGKLSFNPIQISAIGASETIGGLLNTVVLPAIQKIISTLPPIEVPQIDIEGLALAPPIPYIVEGKALGLTSRLNQPTVTPPVGFQWPAPPFSFLLKQDFIMDIANQVLTGYSHTLIDIEHGFDIDIASAKFQISATLSDFKISPGASATDYNLTIKLHGKGIGNVWSVPAFWPIGVNFDISTEKPINAGVSVYIENKMLILKCTRIDDFNVILNPSGGVAEWIISLFTSPILEFLISILRPRIEEWLKGKTIELFEIPGIASIPLGDKTISIKTDNIKLVSCNGYIAIEGDVAFD